MKINAYILACDQTWIEHSVLSYYDFVDEIVVSFDQSKRGWSGVPIPVDECLDRLRKIDRDHKIRLCPGDFARLDFEPLVNDTFQRQHALAAASDGADWVLELDTDELLPNPPALIEFMKIADEKGIPVVEWPMRVFFQRLADGRFLEVCAHDGSDVFEYPGPVACKPGVDLTCARRAAGAFLRGKVKGDRHSLQTNRQNDAGEHRVEFCNAADAIQHFSWARPAEQIRQKIASWGHNEGIKTWLYYHACWKLAPYLWRWMRNIHPMNRGTWPALKPAQATLIPAHDHR